MKIKYAGLMVLSLLFCCACNNNDVTSFSSVSTNENLVSSVEENSSSVSLENSISSMLSVSEESSYSYSSYSSISSSELSSSVESSANSKISSISSTISSSIVEESNIPGNINNKVALGSDNKSMSTFEFKDSTLPDYFRAIYGNNFVKGNFYADGTLKISSTTKAKQGFQTCAFISNLKLEIRLLIGQMNNSNDGNKIDKDAPVLIIDGFNDSGEKIRTIEIDTFDKSKENSYIRTYMDGTDISYLEVRANQLPYKSSQTYNFAFRGISLIAWPYPLN